VPLRERAPLLSQLPAWFPGGGLPSDTPLVMEEYGQQCAPLRPRRGRQCYGCAAPDDFRRPACQLGAILHHWDKSCC